MKKKICRWFYKHGMFNVAYRISPAYTMRLLVIDLRRDTLKAAFKEENEKKRMRPSYCGEDSDCNDGECSYFIEGGCMFEERKEE